MSIDSTLTRILDRLEGQDATTERHHKDNKDALDRIETQVEKTNGRVSALEKWRWVLVGGAGATVTLIGWYLLLHPGH